MDSDLVAEELLESAPDAMIVVDASGTILLANRRAYTLFGYSAPELVDRSIEELVPARFRGKHRNHRSVYTASPSVRQMGHRSQELAARRADGSEFPVEISLSPVSLNRNSGHAGGHVISAAIRDASDRKAAEEALAAALRREREASAQLREVDRLKDEFLSIVSHELRTPLTAIGGFAEILSDGYGAGLPREQQAELITRIAANAQEMQIMVEQLLDYSRLTAGRVQIAPRPTELGAVVQEVLESFRQALAEHNVVVDVPAGTIVDVDRVGFARVVGNFLTNATKFSPAGSTITVRGSVEDGTARVDVIDEGVGIPAEELDRVFDRFFQGEIATSTRRGAGIGLSIASRYAEMHGGEIRVSSTLGEGATFSFLLPVSS